MEVKMPPRKQSKNKQLVTLGMITQKCYWQKMGREQLPLFGQSREKNSKLVCEPRTPRVFHYSFGESRMPVISAAEEKVQSSWQLSEGLLSTDVEMGGNTWTKSHRCPELGILSSRGWIFSPTFLLPYQPPFLLWESAGFPYSLGKCRSQLDIMEPGCPKTSILIPVLSVTSCKALD